MNTWVDDAGREWPVPSNRQRLKFNYPSHRAIRAHVFRRDGFRCRSCGWSLAHEPTDFDGRYTIYESDARNGLQCLHMDHVVPFSRGGSNHPDNFQTLCFSCNSAKRDRMAA